ncbi:formyltetrahydrofolate deformylase [Woeseia oceani]|uniref:Formyltetrahydrofolate deformylase n=1 Tax=Woeseia oceani TaxID=1548547 RepID=A0A193LH90_9GAMM|nr:formyltetrahydrofolate deformylase [Woeseia oceani]ANO51739.1 formyltetrahydrofolate deformylase [Woeseia oceani]
MQDNQHPRSLVLSMSCPDRGGIVAAITGFIADSGGSITETAHFVDRWTERSFMRASFSGSALASRETLADRFAVIAEQFDMDWHLYDAEQRCRVLLAVSKQGHVLNNLLHRWSIGSLPIDIVGVVSNHPDMRSLTEWYKLPYHYLPVTPGDKAAQERQILELFASTGADLLALARYMQILSADACETLAGRAINIHHSFLPGFKGAKPYHQAHERGVKIIGATAHFVTTDLDEGPIIEQGVERVDHTMGPDELAKIGHDLESVVFTRAVRWFAEHRIFPSGSRTVVLRS